MLIQVKKIKAINLDGEVVAVFLNSYFLKKMLGITQAIVIGGRNLSKEGLRFKYVEDNKI